MCFMIFDFCASIFAIRDSANRLYCIVFDEHIGFQVERIFCIVASLEWRCVLCSRTFLESDRSKCCPLFTLLLYLLCAISRNKKCYKNSNNLYDKNVANSWLSRGLIVADPWLIRGWFVVNSRKLNGPRHRDWFSFFLNQISYFFSQILYGFECVLETIYCI